MGYPLDARHVCSQIVRRGSERSPRILPDYTVRESARAKYARLQVNVSDGLVVVVPKGFDRRRIPQLLEEKAAWIARAMQHVEAQRADRRASTVRPPTIELPAIGHAWRLDWERTNAQNVIVTPLAESGLRVAGPIDDPAVWRPALRRWLIDRGREHLIPWAEAIARELDVTVGRVSVRCQKTRWGSLTTRPGRPASISLNAQLLFLPERLVRFVVVHELCHADHPNHSPDFWDLVRANEPNVNQLRAELRTAGSLVPPWARRSLAEPGR